MVIVSVRTDLCETAAILASEAWGVAGVGQEARRVAELEPGEFVLVFVVVLVLACSPLFRTRLSCLNIICSVW